MQLTNANLSYGLKNPSGLAVLGYGLGNTESYYYLAGSALRKLDASIYVNGVHNQDLEIHPFCSNNSINVKAVVRYIMHTESGHIKWFIDDVEKTAFEDKLEWSETLPGGTYKISMVVKNEYGTMDTIRTSVTIDLAEPDLQVKDTAVCYGETVTLSASSSDAVLLQWYSDSNYSDLISQGGSFTTSILKSDTAFYVEAVSADGCISRDTVHITVLFLLPVLTVKDTTVCFGAVALFTVSSQNASSLTWFSDAAYSDAVNHTPSYETVVIFDTVFYIEALSDKGCSVKDKMNISVTTLPAVVAMDDVYLCYGEEITLSVLESEGTVSWNVDPITVRPLHSQDYIVTASKPFCPDSHDTVMVTVGDSLYIYPAKLPDYSAHAEYEQQIGSNAQSPTFTLAGGSLPFGLNLYYLGNISGHASSDATTSVFTVKVEDEHNCATTREYILEKEFSPPKVFTPNNDGINDYFMKGYKVAIFDRFGMEIFKGDDGWDGTYKNKLAPHDIYFYKITHESIDGKIKINTGYVGIE
jgi:gliding motility-associated-like protein